MQRGILELNKAEAQLSLNLIPQSTQDLSQLAERLTMVVNGAEEISTIEVDRNQVEALLDALPMPSETEDQNYKVLRNKLSMFLVKKNE